jgi:two-component system OmpR family sensor kinase
MALGDEHRLHQVLVNLLSNAGRHTPPGTTVSVRLSAEEPPGDHGSGLAEPDAAAGTVTRGTQPAGPRVVLAVTDDGPGIEADLLPELFERFTRADTARSHSSDESSTGLGLAIVEAVVAAHGGAVTVASRPGLTRFAIVVPYFPDSAPVAPASAGAPRRPIRLRLSGGGH